MNSAERRELALAILIKGQGLTRASGQFLGQLCAEPTSPLSDKQEDWFGKLCLRAGVTAGNGGSDD